MAHAPQVAPVLANIEAVQRARRQATIVTCAGAIVPTILAMQGMASLAVDLLGFPVVVAVALAGFLELALVSFALLTRASALAGRPGGIDAAAVWGVSLASGLFSSAHELVGVEIAGVRSWEVDPGSLIAAAVRLAAPLVAALLWERVLTAARREHEARSLVEVRRDRRLIAVAKDALDVREMEDNTPRRLPGQSRTQAARLRVARRRLRRSHIAALRMVGPGADLRTVLAAVGAVDVLPAWTIQPGTAGRSGALSEAVSVTPAALADTRGSAAAGTFVVADSAHVDEPLPVHLPNVSSSSMDRPSAADADLADVVTDKSDAPVGVVAPLIPAVADSADASLDPLDVELTQMVDLAAATPEVPADLADAADSPALEPLAIAVEPAPLVDLAEPVADASVAVADTPDSAAAGTLVVADSLSEEQLLAITTDLILAEGKIPGSRVAEVMRENGQRMAERTGLRWRDKAMIRLDAAASLN